MTGALAYYRKAVAAFLLAVGTWGATAATDGINGAEWFGLIVALATALGVGVVGNAQRPTEVEKDAGMTAVEALVVGLILILLAAFVFGYAGRG